MAAAMASSGDVSGAAHLPAGLIHDFDGLHVTQAVTVLRLEGVAPSVRHRRQALAALMRSFGSVEHLEEGHSRTLWRSVRDSRPLSATGSYGDWPLWRVSTAPSRGGEIAALAGPQARLFHDWAGGLIWLALPPTDDGGAATVRGAVRELGGHATLIRAPAAVRAAVDVFQPQDRAVAAVSKRVKDGFDPKGVLNPGRMWAGV
jgi:glycolate oxidase FAD binding subunit